MSQYHRESVPTCIISQVTIHLYYSTAKNKSSVTAWREENWREQDWSELPRCTDVIYPEPTDLGEFLYEENPDLDKFRYGKMSNNYSFITVLVASGV